MKWLARFFLKLAMWANEDAVIEAFDRAGFQMPNTEAANDRYEFSKTAEIVAENAARRARAADWAEGYFSRWPMTPQPIPVELDDLITGR